MAAPVHRIDSNMKRRNLLIVLFLIIIVGIDVGWDYYREHHPATLRSLSRDVGRHTWESDLCGKDVTIRGRVYSQEIAGDYKEYSIDDDDGGILKVHYYGDPPKIHDIVRVSGNLGCHMKPNFDNILGSPTTIIDYMVLDERSRSVR